ncbi:MAG: PTS sugar transporter subunit IIB [Gemmatimonadota bacterium]|nr:PTS sugar transporter subunit IIB [Gemmatimonadota bacterium]
MGIELYRIDDRLIHGQVVVGWGQRLSLGFVVLVDDQVAASDWEQELYRMAVPPEMDVYFSSVADAAGRLPGWQEDTRKGILITGDIETMSRLVQHASRIAEVNLGGIHHRGDRAQRLRYVYLTPGEESALRALSARGIEVSARDVPAARAVPLLELLDGKADS